MTAKVILLVGPAGSGKTSIAQRIAKNDDWVHVSEDELWVAIKHRRPSGELRTKAEQAVVQRKAFDMLVAGMTGGKNVVLEFIIYERPPEPLLFYRRELDKLRRSGTELEIVVRALKPSVDAILARMNTRGRRIDSDVAAARLNAQHQIACLESKGISSEWLIDSSDESLETTYVKHFQRIVES